MSQGELGGVSAIVLCGGRSRRMGRDKASLPFGPETLLTRVVRLLREVTPDVVAVAREGQILPDGLDAIVARDPAEGLGPLAGITAGCQVVRSRLVFVAACDLPLLKPALVRRLFELMGDHDACVPVIDGFAMATCAVYSRDAGPAAAALLASGELRASALADRLRTRRVGREDLLQADPHLESFHDCNTPERYEAALRAAGYK